MLELTIWLPSGVSPGQRSSLPVASRPIRGRRRTGSQRCPSEAARPTPRASRSVPAVETGPAAGEVEPGRADEGARRDGGAEPHLLAVPGRVLLDDDGVRPRRHGAAGEDPDRLAGCQAGLVLAARRRLADQPERAGRVRPCRRRARHSRPWRRPRPAAGRAWRAGRRRAPGPAACGRATHSTGVGASAGQDARLRLGDLEHLSPPPGTRRSGRPPCGRGAGRSMRMPRSTALHMS